MNISELIGTGILYSFSAFKKQLERRVDRITIKHGLGEELHEGVDYLLNCSSANEAYRQGQQKHYLSPSEIKAEIKNVWHPTF